MLARLTILLEKNDIPSTLNLIKKTLLSKEEKIELKNIIVCISVCKGIRGIDACEMYKYTHRGNSHHLLNLLRENEFILRVLDEEIQKNGNFRNNAALLFWASKSEKNSFVYSVHEDCIKQITSPYL